MRKLSSNYRVHYAVLNKKGRAVVSNLRGTTCYRDIYYKDFNSKESIVLSNFLCEETADYCQNYLDRLSKIFGIKIINIKQDKIQVSGFKNKLQIKIFLSMFRLLFEIVGGYGQDSEKKDIENNIKFFKAYTDEKSKCPYAKELSRYIYFYSLYNVYQGQGHGLSKNRQSGIRMVSKTDILKAGHNVTVQSFFQIPI